MGNCFGKSSAASPPRAPATNSAPPAKKQRTATTSAPPAKKQRRTEQQPFVTDQVQTLRTKGTNYHQKAVACAKQSQDAWKNGDKAKAHTLSEEKKALQQKRNDANRQAAKRILDAQTWQSSGEIDLHGLYLDEALDATRKFLTHWSKKSKPNRETVLVITGAGNHSENKMAVIRPKVEELLQKERLEYESVHGNGAFRVTLQPSQ